MHYAWWLPVGIFAAGIVFIPLGFAIRRYSGRLGWGLMIAGPIAVLAFAPSLFMEGVRVDDRGFDVRSGIWGMTANQSVRFDSVRACRIAQEETGGRSSRTIEVLYFDLQQGPEARFALNNDVKIEGGKEIILRVVQRGIPVAGFR